jgi:hypothetical protein
MVKSDDPMFTSKVKQHLCAHDVRLEESARVEDRATVVGFRGEIHNHIWRLLLHEVINAAVISNIPMNKAIPIRVFVGNICEV